MMLTPLDNADDIVHVYYSLQKYIFDDKYEKQCKMKLKTIQRSGVVDSISNLLRNYNCDSKRLVNLLLKPYKCLYCIILALFL